MMKPLMPKKTNTPWTPRSRSGARSEPGGMLCETMTARMATARQPSRVGTFPSRASIASQDSRGARARAEISARRRQPLRSAVDHTRTQPEGLPVEEEEAQLLEVARQGLRGASPQPDG